MYLRIPTSLVSFALGAVSMLAVVLILSGSRTSIVAQDLARYSSLGPDTRPVVAPISGSRFSGVILGGPWRLDGLNCDRCGFKNVRLEYWGGPVSCNNCMFDEEVTIEFKGAALNALQAVKWFQDLNRQRVPIPSPVISMEKATIEKTITADIISSGNGK